jgi:hypothetical protein
MITQLVKKRKAFYGIPSLSCPQRTRHWTLLWDSPSHNFTPNSKSNSRLHTFLFSQSRPNPCTPFWTITFHNLTPYSEPFGPHLPTLFLHKSFQYHLLICAYVFYECLFFRFSYWHLVYMSYLPPPVIQFPSSHHPSFYYSNNSSI